MSRKKKVETKEVFGFSRYSVNIEEGTVYSHITEATLHVQPNINGYVYYNLVSDSGKNVTIGSHRFMMMANLGFDLPEGFVVDHLDGNRSNNKIENLELITQAENLKRREVPKTHNKLTKEQKVELYTAFSKLKLTYGTRLYKLRNLAEEYGISLRAMQTHFKTYQNSL